MFREILLTTRLKNFSRTQGVSLFGIADISDLREEFDLSGSIKEHVSRAVCLGVGLSGLLLSEVMKEPTKLYYHHYRTANMTLDRIAFAVAQWIEERGFLSVPVPASQITDWKEQKAHLSHKKLGQRAGLGWIGRNNLLVSKRFGSQFRLATVLTDMPLAAGTPLKDDCGRCFDCVSVCPVGAIQREARDFKHLECFKLLQDFQRRNIVGQFICGICVNACRGQRKKE